MYSRVQSSAETWRMFSKRFYEVKGPKPHLLLHALQFDIHAELAILYISLILMPYPHRHQDD